MAKLTKALRGIVVVSGVFLALSVGAGYVVKFANDEKQLPAGRWSKSLKSGVEAVIPIVNSAEKSWDKTFKPLAFQAMEALSKIAVEETFVSGIRNVADALDGVVGVDESNSVPPQNVSVKQY
ncbi:MAG: hypothetical protein GY804_04725 [Alphaproteobacteria bacterium]|nr:hypothetical protein [Alphaproteobacteria bacterium]